MVDPKPTLDGRETQHALGISSATFYRWLREGRLKGTKVGGRWRFERRLVDALLGAGDPDAAADLERARRLCADRLRAAVEPAEISAMNLPEDDAEATASLLIGHAVARKATDLHLAPEAAGLGVRERVDGVLTALEPPLPKGAAEELLEVFKRRAGLDLSVADRPQGGQFFADVSGRKIDVRASTFPTWQGESLTLRLVDPQGVHLRLRDVRFTDTIYNGILAAIRHPRGVFLVNGPTGAGKSTTLYCALVQRYRPGLKVMTAEDPVEYHLDGILQANVTPAMSHLDAMRGMLLNDLDVGMVSELRDAESIRLLFQMAATGHLMLSALHASSAVAALSRLLTVGRVEPAILTDTLRGILDQRLVGSSCRHCRTERKLDADHGKRLRLPAKARRGKFAYNVGCEPCNGTGNLGRAPIAELLELTPALSAMIEAGETAAEVLEAGLPLNRRTLRDDLLEKLRAGEVSPPEAIRALGL